MKTKNPLVLLMGWLAVALGPTQGVSVHAAAGDVVAQATGTVTGRVQNVASGQYLTNARVAVAGTNRIVFSDEAGTYRLSDLPAGPVVLDVFYTGLDRQQITVTVPPGGVIERNVELTNAALYGAQAAVKLDAVTVKAARDLEGDALAINEQRFAPNIKNVIATDALGEITGQNVGEFLKFVPGLVSEYSGDEIVGVSARGLPGAMTNVFIDGAQTATAQSVTRQTYLLGLALNGTSRVEFTKVPTPSMPADSVGGSINLVSKSAFERKNAELRYGLSLLGNTDEYSFKKSPSQDDKNSYKVVPAGNFDYTLPVNDRFGIVVTGMYSNQYKPVDVMTRTFNTSMAGTSASISTPLLQQLQMFSANLPITRRSASIKADWKVTSNSVLSLSSQASDYALDSTTDAWTVSAGTAATPNPANLTGGVGLTYGPDFTIGASGRGLSTYGPVTQNIFGHSLNHTLNYRLDDGRWKVDAGLSLTDSHRGIRIFKRGQFRGVTMNLRVPVRISIQNSTTDRPGIIKAFDNSNQEVDLTNLANYRMTTATANENDINADMQSGKVDVRRRLDLLPFPTSIQIGGLQNKQTRDARPTAPVYTFTGDSLLPYATTNGKWDAGLGIPGPTPINLFKLYRAWQADPGLFIRTPAQLVAEENSLRLNSEWITETVNALYTQGEARMLDNRLQLLAGIRYERTAAKGIGSLSDPNAVYQRDAAGNFVRNAAGARIRRADAGAVGSMEELQLILKERASTSEKTYDGYYPSFHANFNLRENLVLRAAFAQTYSRPNFVNIIPRTTVNQADLTGDAASNPNAVQGIITLRNAALRPWFADNYDLSLEYYTNSGGIMSAGVFRKEITDFFGSQVRDATPEILAELDLGPEYLGWRISTQFNSGNARISGIEFDIRQPLTNLGGWGRYFSVFVNATKLKLEGNRDADFSAFLRETVNWGASFKRQRYSVTARWNYRGKKPGAFVAAYGPDARDWEPARTMLELNFGVQLTPRISLTANLANALHETFVTERYGSSTPGYAQRVSWRDVGQSLSVGMKGSF